MVCEWVPLAKFQNLQVQSKELATTVELYPPALETMTVVDSTCADI